GVGAPNISNVQEFALRTAQASDITALRTIAREAHQDSRFFFDTNFPRAQAEELFATWIVKDCEGRADKVFIAERKNSGPLGYITCNLSKDSQTGRISLVGVAAESRGRGLGKMLVSQALEWIRSAGTQKVFVVTQARIVAADIRPDTLNLDERQVEGLITNRTKAIVVVHYAGVGCEMDVLLEVAKRHGIAVIEDNAHGLFGKYRGRSLGTFGDLAAQS